MDSDAPLPDDLRLEGEHVVLVPVSSTHAHELFELVHSREEVLRWLIWDGPETVEELAESYEEWCFPTSYGLGLHLSILERAHGERPVGTIGVRYRSQGIGDVGYWLGSEVWGRGLGSEAVRLLSSHALLEQGASALCAWVDVGNMASRRVLEKNGYVFERTVAGKAQKRDGATDQWGFVLTRQDAERVLGSSAEPDVG